MDVQFYRASIHQHGVGATLYHAAYRAANQVTEVAVWNAMMITVGLVAEQFLEDPRRAQGRLVDAGDMRRFVSDPGNALTEPFIDEAVQKGDRCYGLFDGDVLMSYGWYSTRPTRLTEVAGEPVLHFDPSYAYMYNGFTLPKYRGQRLHAIGMAAALERYTEEGEKGLVSYVDSSNFASLKSCYRMGFQNFGHVVMLKVGARHVWRSTPGCKKYGFRVEAAAG
jgi:ribosomal protein S18 acetylase RimI-like enzyme